MEFNIEDYKAKLRPMIKHFNEFCRDNSLRYSLFSGSLLGAVRHQGIIPWDDDVDFVMPRPDYERFLKLTQDGYYDGYKISSIYNNDHHATVFTKVYDTNTTLVEIPEMPKFITGVYIDIFPVDCIPDDDEEANKMLLSYLKLSRRGYYALCKPVYNNIYSIPHSLKVLYNNVLYNGNRQYKTCERIASSVAFGSTSKSRVYCSSYNFEKTYDSSIFEEYVDYSFEGMQIQGVKRYDEYLKIVFKDFMQLPPIEKRMPHHSKFFIDLNHGWSYDELKKKSII